MTVNHTNWIFGSIVTALLLYGILDNFDNMLVAALALALVSLIIKGIVWVVTLVWTLLHKPASDAVETFFAEFERDQVRKDRP